jgi:hypothetical protein
MGRDGSGGAPNRYWEVDFADGLNLPAGTYTIIDSRPETWSWTEDVGNRGHSYVFALKGRSSGSMVKVTGCISNRVDSPADADPYTAITEGYEGSVADIQVGLAFTYVPQEYASNTPTSMTTSTDQTGGFVFEVPPGSKFKIIVKGKEYDGEKYSSLGYGYCIEIGKPPVVYPGTIGRPY